MKLFLNRKYFWFLPAGILLILGITFFVFYLNQINIAGEIFIKPNNQIKTVKAISPLNKIVYINTIDGKFEGYYKSIVIESECSEIVITNTYLGRKFEILLIQIAPNKYNIENEKLSTIDKIKVVLFYNQFLLLKSILFIIVFILIVFYKLKISSICKTGASIIKNRFYSFILFLEKNKIKLIWVLIIDLVVCLILRFLLRIDFAMLYGCSAWLIYPFVCSVFFIPIFGLLLDKQIKKKMSCFFAFWFIFFLQYFIISPNDFVGNFGFHGAFQNYIQVSSDSDFIRNILTPDTGYLAILPRIIYWFSAALNPSMSQIIAITSLFALVIYSFIMSSLLKKELSFLWVDGKLGFVFVIIISIFPVFSLTPGALFPLPITDVSYYGILFAIISLFMIGGMSSFQITLLGLFNCILILSKAHSIVLLPVFAFSIFLFWKQKNIKALWFSVGCILAIIIQSAFCYNSLNSAAVVNSSAISSFSINTMSLLEQIFFATIYFVKSYTAVLFPFIKSNSSFYIVALGFSFYFILFLFYKCIRIIFYENKKSIAFWYIACSVTALSSSFFYAHTLTAQDVVELKNLVQFIDQVKLNLIRYTIGVHTLLVVSVIPFLAILCYRCLQKIDFRFKYTFSCLFFLILFFNGMIFNKGAFMFPEFWQLIQNDRWSSEWGKIAPMLKQKEHYIPIIFYPAYKQNICTDGLEVALDILPENEASFKMSTPSKINTIIVLNKLESSPGEIPFYVQLYHNHLLTNILNPYYLPNNDCRFIIFKSVVASNSDSLVFKNGNFENVKLTTHIRVISEKKQVK